MLATALEHRHYCAADRVCPHGGAPAQRQLLAQGEVLLEGDAIELEDVSLLVPNLRR
ncbi:hypothetical protein [Arthrobacter ulcerisalmonis]|uniref:hypothetical protein n=1 Tax=Arthrobacter ulcerisalmonis TaxID=2483813 RepID=UPI00366F0A9D